MNYTDEWEEYREPLARLFKEVKKALPDTKIDVSEKFRIPSILATHIMHSDEEVRDELERLLTQIIKEIEND